MEICGQNLQKDCSIDINGACILKKTKGDCGCEFLKPVSGFECHICKVFLRSKNSIEDHFNSIEHLKIYKVHLQYHVEHTNSIRKNQDNVNSGRDQMADGNDELKECNVAGNPFKRHLLSMVHDGSRPEDSDPKISNTKQQRKRTFCNRVDRELTENENKEFNENQTQSRSGMVDVQFSVDNIAKDNLVQSAIAKNVSDSSERCETVKEIETGGSFKGGESKVEDSKINTVDVNWKVSTTTEQIREKDQCDDIATSFQREQGGACTIKQEEDDGDLYDDVGGIIGGFLEGSDDNLLDNDDHYNGELMPRYTSDHDSQTKRSINDETEKVSKVTSAAISSSFANETCTTTAFRSEDQWPPIISSEYKKSQGIDREVPSENTEETSATDGVTSLENDANVNLNLNTCSDQHVSEAEPHQKWERSSEVPRTAWRDGEMENGDQDELRKGTEDFNDDNHKAWNIDINAYESKSTNPHLCTEYEEYFTKSQELERHYSVHSNKDRYSVDMCDRFNAHQHRKEYRKDRPFSCSLCVKTFKRGDALKVHERIHTGEEPYLCSFCGKSFKRSNVRKVHERIHTGEKPYLCNTCGKSFKTIGHLAEHERLHTGEKPYSCNVCGKSFSRISHVNVHERIHSGEKPFSCNVCGKSFKQGSNLKMHEKIHTGEKPFSCNVCGRSFNQASNLKKHEKVHTGERPYSCEVCGRTFTRSTYCERHKRTHTEEGSLGSLPTMVATAGKNHPYSNSTVDHSEHTNLPIQPDDTRD